jgi:hypothetical protein
MTPQDLVVITGTPIFTVSNLIIFVSAFMMLILLWEATDK